MAAHAPFTGLHFEGLGWSCERKFSTLRSPPLKTQGCAHLKVVQWLVARGGKLNIASAMEHAIVLKQLGIVCYMDAQRNESVEEMRSRLRGQPLSCLRKRLMISHQRVE
jgi:hypothetical protein